MGNIELKVTNSDRRIIDYQWTFADENGVKADRKNIQLSYENGQLKGFLNNWPLYSVKGTPKISAEQAQAIAIEASKTFSYKVTLDDGTVQTITGFDIASESLNHGTLAYLNYNNENDARENDPFALYPAWHVPLGFNKFYPGGVSGVVVIIWADTGEISKIHEMVTDRNFAQPATEETVVSSSIATIEQSNQGIYTLIAVITVLVISTIVSRKRGWLSGKSHGRKFWATLLCGLIMFLAIPTAFSQVSALPLPYGKSRVYSMEWTPDGYHNATADNAEATAAAEVANYVGNITQNNGYSTTNWHGQYTTVNNVISYIAPDEQNYGRTILYHSGHFSVRGRAYQSYGGSPIYDTNIYSQTGVGTHSFVFIWVCTQAENPEVSGTVRMYNYPTNTLPGTPIAWTHRDGTSGHPYMNADGYANPDWQNQVYISFYGFSPMLSGLPLNTFFGVSATNCKEFIKRFYYYAITYDMSVHDALDHASSYYFGEYYSTSVLYEGYDAYWPGGDNDPPFDHSGFYPRDFGGGPQNKMKVYGDSRLHLYQPKVTLAGNQGLSPTFQIDGYYYGPGDVRITPATHRINVNDDFYGYDWNNFYYQDSMQSGNIYYRPVDLLFNRDASMTANYDWVPYILIESVWGGTTNPPPGYYEGSGVQAIYAYADPGYHLDHWNLNGGYLTGAESPIYIEYNNWWTVTPVFAPDQPTDHYVNVHAIDTYFGEGQPLTTDVWIDGQWRGYTYENILVSQNVHDITVSDWINDPVFGWIPFYYWTDDSYTNILSYSTTLSMYIGTDTTVIAWYQV